MLETPLMSVLERSLDYASMQQAATSGNLSNYNTPGYQRKDASFETVLAAAGDSDQTMPLTGLRDDDRHLPINNLSAEGTKGVGIVTQQGGAMRLDGNNIDIDVEMAHLAQNQVYYQGVSQLMGSQFSGLKYVIAGGK